MACRVAESYAENIGTYIELQKGAVELSTAPLRLPATSCRRVTHFGTRVRYALTIGVEDNGCPMSSKYWRVTLNTIGASNRSPIRLGTAINPFSVSARFHTKSTLTLANDKAASTHNAR